MDTLIHAEASRLRVVVRRAVYGTPRRLLLVGAGLAALAVAFAALLAWGTSGARAELSSISAKTDEVSATNDLYFRLNQASWTQTCSSGWPPFYYGKYRATDDELIGTIGGLTTWVAGYECVDTGWRHRYGLACGSAHDQRLEGQFFGRPAERFGERVEQPPLGRVGPLVGEEWRVAASGGVPARGLPGDHRDEGGAEGAGVADREAQRLEAARRAVHADHDASDQMRHRPLPLASAL
jgi:hypothetical protein